MSTDPRTDLPSPKASNFEQRVRETLMTYLGRQGHPLDRGLTLRDLVRIGVLKYTPGGANGGLGPGDGVIGGGGTDGDPDDLTPPPTPTGFAVTAGLTYVFVEHDPPLFAQGRGYLRTRLYGAIRTPGAAAPTFADAVEIAQFTGTVYAYPTNPSTTWHLWIKWETANNVLSASPAGGTNGLVATTGQDVSLLLDLLSGQITESQLYRGLGERINLIEVNQTAITNEAVVRQTATEALAAQISTVSAALDGNAAAIQSEAVARADADGASAQAIEQVHARLDTGDYAAVRLESAASASRIAGLQAQYTVKIDLAGHVSGFGLSSEAPVDEQPTSRFGVRANQFFVAPPAYAGPTAPTQNLYAGYVWTDTSVTPSVTRYYTGSTWTTTPPALPFVVQATPTTINGVNVPAGVYIADAYIANGTITNAKIGNAAIDDAKVANLSASKLTAGSIGVGDYIQSTGFLSGNQGWRISGNGNVEFNTALLRGALAVGGWIQSTNYWPGVAGWMVAADGAAEFDSAAIRGQLTASQIDTRGLTIKDANGNVIFGSGTALNLQANATNPPGGWLNANITLNANGTLSGAGGGQVNLAGLGYSGAFDATRNVIHAGAGVPGSGLGSDGDLYLQTISPVVWWSRIGGTWYVAATQGATFVPGTHATITGAIDAGNISTYISQGVIGEAYIGYAAITTAKIADAAISSAKIGVGQVDTLRVAGENITVSRMGQSYVSRQYWMGDPDYEVTSCQVTVTDDELAAGLGVAFLVFVFHQMYPTNADGATAVSTVYLNGAKQTEMGVTLRDAGLTFAYPHRIAIWSAGTYTISIRMRCEVFHKYWSGWNTVVVQSCKR